MIRRLSLTVLLVLGCACGDQGDGEGLSPAEACTGLAEVVCQKYFECFSADEREAAMIAATEAECVTETEALFECAAQDGDGACDEGETYSPSDAEDCVTEYQALACEVVRDGPDDGDTPACARSCQ